MSVKNTLKVDDTLDVFAVHGVGSIFGIIMLAVLGYADWTAQLGGLAVVGIYTLVITFILVKLVAVICPISVSEEDEITGLDLTSHGERAYDHAS